MPRLFNLRNAPTSGWATSEAEADPSVSHLWRELRFAFVPAGKNPIELIHGIPIVGGYAGLMERGEHHGPAFAMVNGGQTWQSNAKLRIGNDFTMLLYIARHDTTASIQSLGGYGDQWTFQYNYGNHKLGLTRWGAGDHPGALPVVPSGGHAAVVGISFYDNFTALFMQDGQFEVKPVAGITVGTNDTVHIGISPFGAGQPVNCAAHVVYFWNRSLSQSEMLAMYRDPFGPIRKRQRRVRSIVSSLTGRARVTQLVGEILAQPDPTLRLTQVVAEVLVPVIPTALRLTQAVAEVLIAQTSGTTRARLTQALAEVLTAATPSLRATQIVAEALVAADTNLRFTQAVAEVLAAGDPALRVSQSLVEVLVATGALTPTYTGQLFPRGSPPPY